MPRVIPGYMPGQYFTLVFPQQFGRVRVKGYIPRSTRRKHIIYHVYTVGTYTSRNATKYTIIVNKIPSYHKTILQISILPKRAPQSSFFPITFSESIWIPYHEKILKNYTQIIWRYTVKVKWLITKRLTRNGSNDMV